MIVRNNVFFLGARGVTQGGAVNQSLPTYPAGNLIVLKTNSQTSKVMLRSTLPNGANRAVRYLVYYLVY